MKGTLTGYEHLRHHGAHYGGAGSMERRRSMGSLRYFHMLGGNEFRLRRGFACGKTLVRRISAAGQKAGWVVFLYLLEISKYRF